MSNFLAIATVTAALKLRLKAIAETAMGVEVSVTTIRPEPPEDGASGPRINLYLFQVTPNAARRNADLPSRNAAGDLVDRPTLALDLHYLLSFHGDEDKLVPQRLLGCVTQSLHAHAVITRKMIKDTIANPIFNYLAKSNLADEIELVKFTPIANSLEELSKLWAIFFQTPYALSLAYQGTVVSINSEESHQAALPVRERNLYVAPFRQPVIEEVRSPAGTNQPIVSGSTLVIRGQRLNGEGMQVRVGPNEPVNPITLSDTEFHLPLTEPPFSAAALRAGVQGVQLIQPAMLGTPPTQHGSIESNVAAFVLQPTVVPPVTVATVDSQTQVTLQLNPNVGKDQRVVLLLNELGSATPKAYSFTAATRASDTDTIAVPIRGVKKPADYLVRVQIDGAESPLNADVIGRYVSPKVTIP